MALPQPTTRVLRGTVAYAAASVIQRAIGFLLLPLYARVLTPGEYGQIAVVTTVTAALGTLLGLGLETAVFRTYSRLRDQPRERRRFTNTVGTFTLVAPLLVAALAGVGLSPIIERMFEVPRLAVTLGFLGAALSISATVVPLAILRAQERFGDFVRLSGVQVVVTVGFTLTFVVLLRWGVLGWMLSIVGAAAILLVTGLVVLGHRWTSEMDWRHLTAALAFGLPMIPHALAQWGLSLSDRAILGAFLESSDVGVYYVAYQFGLPISVISIALSQAVQPLYAEASIDDERHSQLAPAASHQFLTTALLTMVVALLGPLAVQALLPSSYAPAASLIPWIALGHGLFGLYFIPINAITILSGRNRWVWVVTVTAALANIGLNLVFVPRIGAAAAAINTCIGYAILLIGVSAYMYRVVERPVAFQWSRIGLGSLLVVVAVGSAMFLTAENLALDLITRMAAIAVVVALFAALGLMGGPLAFVRTWRHQTAPKR